jgi:hypothetical protein
MAEQATTTVVPVNGHVDAAADSSRKRGLVAVRACEFKWLSHVIYMALSEARGLVRDAEDTQPASVTEFADRRELLVEALACLSTAEHYLRMLDNPTF